MPAPRTLSPAVSRRARPRHQPAGYPQAGPGAASREPADYYMSHKRVKYRTYCAARYRFGMQDANEASREATIRLARVALGSRLREIRESRGMTLTAVARQAGLSRSFYTQVEQARQTISVDRAFALANVLGVEMTELFSAFPPVPYARPY